MLITKTVTTEHELFRQSMRRFCDKEIAPFHRDWEAAGIVPRALWKKAGEAGFLCCTVSGDYGGGGVDFLYSAIVIEELARVWASGPQFSLHSDIVAPYIEHYGSEAQKKAWLPRMASGEVITAIAMTEPGAGSDLQGVRTSAVRDGDDLVINGQKTFITNGQLADLIVVVCKTDPAKGAHGTSLVLVEATRKGFGRGRNLEKVGMKAQDTSELFFDNVRVPASNLLGGEPGMGFIQLMQELPRERLLVAIAGQAAAERALEATIQYVNERKAFGKPIASFQNTRFKLAEMKTEITVGRAFLDQCVAQLCDDKLDVATAAMAKLWHSEMQGRVMDECLQLFGGYGYMAEYPIGRAWADARVQRIYGGTSEIMKELIARSL